MGSLLDDGGAENDKDQKEPGNSMSGETDKTNGY